MSRVLLLTDSRMERHDAPGHPERPARLAAVASGVADAAAASGATLELRSPQESDVAALERIHSTAYLSFLERAGASGGAWPDPDTYVGPHSFEAARLAAGATIETALAVAGGDAEVAFAVVRPPGHHAASERAAGFCLLNNVALAVAALRAAGAAQRIAVVDFDVHHGDGTQAIFDADADLCYASTHQYPFYPGTGAEDDTGIGSANGTKHNVPLPAGSDDAPFLAAWQESLLPAIEAFAPEAILVSAGFDAHADDPLAMLRVSDAGYRSLAESIGALAAHLGLPGVALTLEGGYDLDALRRSAAATVEGLLAGLDGARDYTRRDQGDPA
jgi:acetoin utilization deacetylase AcuC-like enzyme